MPLLCRIKLLLHLIFRHIISAAFVICSLSVCVFIAWSNAIFVIKVWVKWTPEMRPISCFSDIPPWGMFSLYILWSIPTVFVNNDVTIILRRPLYISIIENYIYINIYYIKYYIFCCREKSSLILCTHCLSFRGNSLIVSFWHSTRCIHANCKIMYI